MSSSKQFVNREDIGGGINRASGTREVEPRHWYHAANFRFREDQRTSIPRKIRYDTLPGSTSSPVSPVTVVYVVPSDKRLIYQSADGNYWDVTPGTDGVINPTVITAPSDPAQIADISIDFATSAFTFQDINGDLIQLDSDVNKGGWYLYGLETIGSNFYTTDVIFTYASGFSLKFTDSSLNIWKLAITNDGEFQAVVV